MSNPLQLPINPDIDLNNASYKNPARLLVRAHGRLKGWTVWYHVAGRSFPIEKMDFGVRFPSLRPSSAVVFSAKQAPKLGVNVDIARTGGLMPLDIHNASHFGIFAVAPDGKSRSLVWWNVNDKYDPSGKLGVRGKWPLKVERAIFARSGRPFPPHEEPKPEEPEVPTKPPKISEIDAYAPGNPDALLWDVVADVPIFARMDGADLVITWPRGSFKTWHYRTMKVHDDKPERDVFGTVELIYYTVDGEWVCDAADHVAHGHHDAGIRFDFEEKLRGGERMVGSPIGIVVTGRSRNNPNASDKDKHRTKIKGFSMPDLEPIEWGEETPPPDDLFTAEQIARIEEIADDRVARAARRVAELLG